MNIASLISFDLPVLNLQDSGERAMGLMKEYRVFHLPLVQRDNYIALISEDDLLDWDTPEEPLSLAEFLNFRPIVFENMHPYDAAKTAKELNLTVLPIVNSHNHYMGVVTTEKLFEFITDNQSIKENGAILVIELEHKNYSLSEISRICESNNVSILSSSVRQIENSNMLQVTLKLNQNDTAAVVATFERFNYHVAEVFSVEKTSQDVEENLNSLMHYLNL